MTDHESNDTPELGDLRDGPSPPLSLEDRTLRELRREGLIRGEPVRWRAPVIAVAGLAASVALFSFGLAVGRMMLPAGPADLPQQTFALLLREPAGLTGGADTPDLVEEYRAWANIQHEKGHLVGGEKLDDAGRWLRRVAGDVESSPIPVAADQSLPIGGYFMIRAEDYDGAVRIARSCPHLKHGGTIEIRAIDKP